MTRQMIDCTHDAVQRVRALFPRPEMVAWYSTGSPDIRWTDADLAEFQGSIMVDIDQGFTGSPVPTANVRDVENGAWLPQGAVTRAGWNVARPTIYCSRDTLPRVVTAGWRGDVWLADPGFAGISAPTYPGVNIVAIQNITTADYDTSIVFDPYWPYAKPAAPSPSFVSFTVNSRTADAAWTRVDSASHYVIEYQAAPNVQPVLVTRALQPSNGMVVHASNLMIPGAHGGMMDVYAIVDAKPVHIGSQQLP